MIFTHTGVLNHITFLRTGVLKYYTLPPLADTTCVLESSVVTEFSREFRIQDMV